MEDSFDDTETYTVRTVTLSGCNVWAPATADEASPTTFARTVENGIEQSERLSFVPSVQPATRGVFIHSNDPAEPNLFLPWPRLGYRLRLR